MTAAHEEEKTQRVVAVAICVIVVVGILAATVASIRQPPPEVTAGECRTMCKLNDYDGWLYDPVTQECTCIGSSA